MKRRLEGRALLRLVDRCLREGASIEIDGMGSFRLNAEERVVFEPSSRGRIFLAYAEEDRAEVRKLYSALQRAGFEPWMDQEKLLPGQNWPRAIDRAIDLSDFFVGCFSHRSTGKRGHFQRELGYALDVAASIPAEDIFFIPVRLRRLRSAKADCEDRSIRRFVSRLGARSAGAGQISEAALGRENQEAGELKLVLGFVRQFRVGSQVNHFLKSNFCGVLMLQLFFRFTNFEEGFRRAGVVACSVLIPR